MKNNENEANITNQFQGSFRTSVLDLDLDLIKYSLQYAGEEVKWDNKVLVITCLDQIEGDWRYILIWES